MAICDPSGQDVSCKTIGESAGSDVCCILSPKDPNKDSTDEGDLHDDFWHVCLIFECHVEWQEDHEECYGIQGDMLKAPVEEWHCNDAKESSNGMGDDAHLSEIDSNESENNLEKEADPNYPDEAGGSNMGEEDMFCWSLHPCCSSRSGRNSQSMTPFRPLIFSNTSMRIPSLNPLLPVSQLARHVSSVKLTERSI